MSAKPNPAVKILICTVLAILALGIGAFFYLDLGKYPSLDALKYRLLDALKYLSLDALKENRDALLAYTNTNYFAAAILFVVVYFVQTAFSLPGGAVMTLVGGFLFGSVIGTLLVNVGATAGATCAFLAARYVLRDWVAQKFGNKLEPIQRGFAQNAFSYLLALRLIPAFPFFLVNLVSGLTRIDLGRYVVATSVGILPGSFVFAFAGKQLGTINTLGEILSPQMRLAFFFLALLVLMPIVYRKLKDRKSGNHSQKGK